MIEHEYHRQLTPSERIAAALFQLGEPFTVNEFAELAGIDEQMTTEFLDVQEYLGVVTVVDESSPLRYQRADQVETEAADSHNDTLSEASQLAEADCPKCGFTLLSMTPTEICPRCTKLVNVYFSQRLESEEL